MKKLDSSKSTGLVANFSMQESGEQRYCRGATSFLRIGVSLAGPLAVQDQFKGRIPTQGFP